MIGNNTFSTEVIAAINKIGINNSFTAAPYGGYVNSFGMKLLGRTIFMDCFGGLAVTYNDAKMNLLRFNLYHRMPASHYMNNEQLLHHYFMFLTPVNLLADASLQVEKFDNVLVLLCLN